jgi:hypothetical protein
MSLRRSGHYRGQACGRIPRSPHRPVRMFPDIGFNTYAAAVPPSVRFAETEDRSGRRERHRTFAARGFSARFVLIPAPPVAKFVRFHGADGALLGVDGGPAGYIGFNDKTQLLGDSALGVDTHTEPLLWPRPGDPGALMTIGCIFATTSSGGNGWCDWNADDGFVLLSECGRFDVAGGLVSAGVAGVRLTLGSGAQVTLPPGALPAPYGGRRAIATELPAGEAVREAAALDAAGAVVARTPVGTPPGGQPCVGEDQGDDGFVGELMPVAPPPGAVAVASASGESLLVADQGERLCAGLGRLRARVCPSPPADSDRPRLLRRGRAVAGVLSGDAERVTLRLDRGTVTVRTTDGPGYTGRWAGGVGVQLVRRIGDAPCLTAFADDLPPTRRHCTNLHPGTPIDGPFLPYSGTVVVPCAPRAALAFGRMGDGFPAPVVRLDGGRTVRTQRIPLRGKDAFVAFLPDARVRGLQSGGHRVALDLPPAGSQCGYSADRGF